MAGGRATLGVVVITKDEASNIAECLDTVKWADEMIVVDAQSTDKTADIARTYTELVYIRPWPGFGRQKNFGIDQARSDWILILDADERVEQALAEEILEMLSSPPSDAAAFRVPRQNYFYGQWVRWGGAYPDYQIRIFRRGLATYNDIAIHENLLVEGQVQTFSSPLKHYTERHITDHFRKFNLYTSLAASEKRKSCHSVAWHHLICHPFVIFFKTYVLKRGYRDGTRGVIFAVFASLYTFVKYAKLYESMLTPPEGRRRGSRESDRHA